MHTPSMTKELAMRIERSEREAVLSRLQAISRRDGNPMGVDIVQKGEAMLFTIKGIPGPSYNKVLGLSSSEIDQIDDILHFYREREIPCRFELIPGHSSPELFRTLVGKGLVQQDFHTVLYGSPQERDAREATGVSVRRLERNEFRLFAQIYTRGFGMPDFLVEPLTENNEVLYDQTGWTFYVASVDDQPAAVGVLYIENGIGNLAVAATLPEYRKRGCHQALTIARIEDATEAGCDLIVGQAAFGSGSQRNMQRCGMQIAYTKAIWAE